MSVFYAKSFGSCTWDATHDVGPCINTALNAASTAGGGTVVMPVGTYGLSTTITWPTANSVRMNCPSGGGSGIGATTIKWIGAAGGRMVSIKTMSGAVKGAELTNCVFHGNGGLAADGLYLASVDHGHFDDLSFVGGFNGGNVVNITVDGPEPAQGSQNNTFNNLYVDNGAGGSFTSNQFRLGAFMDATGVHGNAAFNRGDNLFIGGNAPSTGILCVGCDNNYFSGRVFNTGTSIDLTVAVSGSHMFPANGNVFAPMFYSGTFVSRGQTTFPTCTRYSSCTYNNSVVIDQTNATPSPTAEPGVDLHWGSNSGYLSGFSVVGKSTVQPGLFVAHDLSIWGACQNNALASVGGKQSAVYLCNSENSPYLMLDSIGGDSYQIDNTGAAGAKNLRFYHGAGTGKFQFSDTVQLDNGLLPQANGVGNIGTAAMKFGELHATDAEFTRMHVTLQTPAGASTCAAGQITADTEFVYVCTAANQWKRATLTAY